MNAHDTILQALRYLANNDQDHAAEDNDIGYNGADSRFGHDLAKRQYLTVNQQHSALKMLRTYTKQLQGAGITLPEDGEIEQAPAFVEMVGALAASEDIAMSTFLPTRPVFPTPVAPVAQPNKTPRIDADGDSVKIVFGRYDPTWVEKVKQISGRSYDPNTRIWHVPLSQLDAVIAAFPTFHLDPKIQESKDKVRAEQEAEAEARRAETEKLLSVLDLDKEYPFGHLFEHQKTAVRAMLSGEIPYTHKGEMQIANGTHGRVILADDMGLGKTKSALLAAKAWHDAFGLYIFVVAPVSLKLNWLREAESVGVRIEVFSWSKIPAPLPGAKYVLIADEAHYAQNLKSTRTQKMLDLADKARAVYLLTGTPIKNGRPANLFPLLKATRHPLADDKKQYEKYFCAAGSTRFSRWDTTGAAHLDELHAQTRNVMLRRLKKDCLDLPEKSRVLRKVDMTPDARRAYDAAFAELRRKYTEGVQAKYARARQLKEWSEGLDRESQEYADTQREIAKLENAENADAIVMLNNLRHAGSIGKVETAIEIADEILDQDGQIVLFTEFDESAQKLHRILGGELLTGATPPDKRQAMVDRFQEGISKVFVGTIKAGGVGITLTAAQTVVLIDRPWTPGDAEQAEDRLHRIGQRNAVTAIWLQANGADEKIDQILTEKYERIGLVLEGKRKTMRGIGSASDVARQVLMDLMNDAPAAELSAEQDEDLDYSDSESDD